MNKTVAILLSLLLASVLEAAETRYHQYTKRFANPTHPAKPLVNSYLGGEGDEYLSGGDFLSSGALVLSGTAYGPTFSIKGYGDVSVIGQDGAAPAFQMPTKTHKGKISIVPPDSTYTKGAGFIVLLDASCTRIEKAVRLPWGAGTLTDIAVGKHDEIIITGTCGSSFDQLVTTKDGTPAGLEGESRIFLGRLRNDLSGFEWCYTLKDDQRAAPKLRVIEANRVSLVAKNAYHFSVDGQCVKASNLALSNNWVRGVDWVSHSEASGGDGNTRTGWEPWRKPVLHIRNSRRELTDSFYRWSEKIVGTNWSRLVSDSSIRALNYDRHGNLLVVGWSDGGNSVLEYDPYDLRRSVYQSVASRTGKKPGLGYSTWGAGVGSFCHLIKIDPASGEVLSKTMYISYLANKNKPNGLTVSTIDASEDNSVLLGGKSAYGFIETSSLKLNSLSGDDYMGGPFVSILNSAMSDYRFASCMPGTGAVPLLRHSSKRQGHYWTGSKKLGGKQRVVFVSGARFDDKLTLKKPVQQGFGGGQLDGHFVVLEMDVLVEQKAVKPSELAQKKSRKKKVEPIQKGTFKVSEKMSRDYSVLVIRDPSHQQWPAYYQARPIGQGDLVSTNAGVKGAFTLFGAGDQVQLRSGSRQIRRIGGELVKKELRTHKDRTVQENIYPALTLRVTLDGQVAQGEVSFNGRNYKVSGVYSVRSSKPTGKGGLDIWGKFKVSRDSLGLSGGGSELEIEFWAPGRK